jgi:DNA-directed RNA polymerase specialized sigma subunit
MLRMNNNNNNNNAYDHLGREKQVIELYNQGKSTRDIAKELRMSLRDISTALRDNQVNHGIVITDNSNENNTKWSIQTIPSLYRNSRFSSKLFETTQIIEEKGFES